MRFVLLPTLAVALLGHLGFAQGGTQEPGSLLVFHEFDNRLGVANLITVTNSASGLLSTDTIDVEFVYLARWISVGETDVPVSCLETNRTRRLTPNDTITVLSKFDNPNATAGFLYVFAKSTTTGQAVKFDHLIGNNLVIDGLGLFEYSVNPFSFKAGGGLSTGANTDVDSDGLRDLNGVEYAKAPDTILVPRFLGQGLRGQGPGYGSDLVLINLSGGAAFQATVNFLIYNDNEEAFSAQYQFKCWDKAPLLNISNVFLNSYLLTTGHNPNEIQGVALLKTGWMRLNGGTAYSTAAQISDPALLAVLIEKAGPYKAADLPYSEGLQANGDLLPQSPFGDTVQAP